MEVMITSLRMPIFFSQQADSVKIGSSKHNCETGDIQSQVTGQIIPTILF